MKKSLTLLLLPTLLALGVTAQSLTEEGRNLLQNGHFDNIADPLDSWIYLFDHNKHYQDNYKYVSVTNDPQSMRQHVMVLDASIHEIYINQGVQVYSAPIRFDPKTRYKISLSAKSTPTPGKPIGPKCRIYPIAYRWHPKAVKSNNPAFGDLREAVRFQPIYFDNAKTGAFSNVPRQWKRVEYMIPNQQRSELQQSHLENCQWLMLKIVALDATGVNKCNTGYLYIDDVKIEAMGPANEVQITPGAATSGFTSGKSWVQEGTERKTLTPIGRPTPSGARGRKTR